MTENYNSMNTIVFGNSKNIITRRNDMKYRKLTDEEVIKSLECCNLKGNCKHCPCWLGNGKCIAQSMLRGALDLIKRQQAQIKEADNGIT